MEQSFDKQMNEFIFFFGEILNQDFDDYSSIKTEHSDYFPIQDIELESPSYEHFSFDESFEIDSNNSTIYV